MLKSKNKYAWFWIRHIAYFLDFLFITISSWLIWIVLNILIISTWVDNVILITKIQKFIFFIIWMLYFVLFHFYFWQTLWKMALWIKVLNKNWKNISLIQSFWRFFATFISALTLFLWYMWAWWDKKKRSFHDFLSWTQVVIKRKTPAWVVFLSNTIIIIISLIILWLMIQTMFWLYQNPYCRHLP